MKRQNLKPAIEIQNKIDEIDKELNAWEVSKCFNSSSIIQIRTEPYIGKTYFDVDLASIAFKDLRRQFLSSLNEKRAELEQQLDNLLNDD